MMTHAKSPVRPILLALFCGLFVLLAGCGGGGGGSAVGTGALVGGETVATVTVTGRVSLPDADKSGVLVSLARTAGAGQPAAAARMVSGEAPVDLDLLARPDLHPERAAAESIFFGMTDASGAYSIPNVPLGDYVIEARRGATLLGAQRQVSVSGVSRQVEVEDIALTPVGILTGTVAFNPALSDRSGVLCYVEGTSLLAVTNASGAYTIAAVPFNSDGSPRAYVITFQRVGFTKAQSPDVTLTSPGVAVTVPLVTLQMAGATAGSTIAISASAGNVIGMERHFNASELTFTVAVPSGTPDPLYMSWPVFSGGLAGAPEVSRAPQRAVAFGPFEPYTATKTVAFPVEGAFHMQARFVMADGQTVVADMPGTLVCDRTPPANLTFAPMFDDQPDGGAPDKCYGNETMLRVAAHDALSRDIEVRVLVDATVVQDFAPLDPTRFIAEPLVLPGTADATHTLQANFRDRAGNVATTQFTVQKLLPVSYQGDSYRGVIPRQPVPLSNLIYNFRYVYSDGATDHQYPASVVPVYGSISGGIYTPPASGNDTLRVNPVTPGSAMEQLVELEFEELVEFEMRVVGDPTSYLGTPFPLEYAFAPVALFRSGHQVPVPFADLTFTIPSVSGTPAGTIAQAGGMWAFTPAAAGSHTITATYSTNGAVFSDTFQIHVLSGPTFQQVRVNGTVVSGAPVSPSTPGFATIDWTLDQPASVTIFYGTFSVPDPYALDAYSKIRVVAVPRTNGTESLYDLSPGTTHYFRIVARNQQGIETISDEYRFVNEYAQPAQPVTFSAPDTGFPVPGASIPQGIDTLLYTFKLQTGLGEAVLLEEIAISAESPDAFNLTMLRELRLLHTASGAVMGTFKSIGTVGGIMVLRFTVNRPFNPASAVHFSLRGIVNEAEGKRVQFNAHPSSVITGAVSGAQVTVNNTNALGALLQVGAAPAFNPAFGGAAGATTIFGGTYSDPLADPPIAIHFASVAVDPITGAATIFPDADAEGRAFIAQTPTSDPQSPFGQFEIYCDTTTSGWSFDQTYHTGTVFVINGVGSPVEIHLVHTSGKKIVFNVQFTEDGNFAVGVADRYVMSVSGLASGL